MNPPASLEQAIRTVWKISARTAERSSRASTSVPLG
jgi:hypothetical protein